MAEPKRRLVMDIVAAPPTPEASAKRKKINWGKLKQLRELFSARKKPWMFCAVAIILIAIAGALGYFVAPSTVKNPFPSTVTASVPFPLYYPDRLPAGYRLDVSSIKQPQNGVITYDLVHNKRATIYISEEATPPKTVLDIFAGNLINPTTFQVPLGKATYGLLASREASAASLVTGNKIWIIINADSSVPKDSFRILLQNLQHP